LSRHGVGPGDVFLFFGLFAEEDSGERHHRIYGYMTVEKVVALGSAPDPEDAPTFAPDHPHFIGERDRNNTLYLGPGSTCTTASPNLRLTQDGGPLTAWTVPNWLAEPGLTYHEKPWRWPSAGTLLSAARGQEFICNVGDDPVARSWLAGMIAEIAGEHATAPTVADDVIITLLRRPRIRDENEQRNDPFWEFGSFGLTGCHRKNLLNPRRAYQLEGKRIAFAQGGPDGFRLVLLTPPVTVAHHGAVCELRWSVSMPLTYSSAPILVDNNGHSDFPALLDEIDGVARHTFVAQFASKFRSRRTPVAASLRDELASGFGAAISAGAERSKRYTDCLPYLPPKVDNRRKETYERLLDDARGLAGANPIKRRC
jgi:hypothetical protein